ncbi:MAG: DUF362 domain-containing protein [Nitrospirae bacterium]|nr:DUF362 domain-containing protein [Nitrospirota bacterium]
MEKFRAIFPTAKDSRILLKPNCNSNMNALTGNTTDLRLMASLLEWLRDNGYTKITIGEGTSSGFHRTGIKVFSRLKIDEIAKRYGARLVDFNHESHAEIEFEDGIKAAVARVCLESDFFINLPKIKTHFETQMSVCLKNLIGCLCGVYEKQKTHRSLYKNILNLNKYIKPNLHIVDGLIAMEGTGPSKGTPIKMGFVMIGTNPYVLDLCSAKVAKRNYQEIPYLKIAEERGLIDPEDHAYIKGLTILESLSQDLKRPQVNALAAFINNPKWQYLLVKIRLSPPFNLFFSSNVGGWLLNRLGLRQDVFIMQDSHCTALRLDNTKCDHCNICVDYCPMSLNLPEKVGSQENGCIKCDYCYLVCPKDAILFEGDIGFLQQQLNEYGAIVKKMNQGGNSESKAV